MNRFALPFVVLALIASPALAKQPPQGFAPALPMAPAPRAADGSIFNVNAGYAGLVTGTRAHQVGDPLTILLVERTTTAKTVSMKTDRDGGASITPPTAGPLNFLNPDSLKASSQSSFKGGGNTSQTSSLAGEVGVTIAEVRPNGTALVRGEKRMLLNHGYEWVQVSGIVRLSDIDEDNRILSSRVANARMEYTGNGSFQRSGREGWLGRFFSLISPF
ncbi:MAG TPA: flagellar basal body L-ring protein FlgH [Novosphingobium sp.]